MGALTHNGEVLQSLPANASQINFNKTGTNLNSTQTENAIKEVNTKVNTNTDDITQLKSGLTNLAGLKFLPVTFADTFEANSNITNGVTVSALTGGVLTSDNQIKGIIMFNGYPYFLFQLTYQGKIILGTDTPRSIKETINVRMVILY